MSTNRFPPDWQKDQYWDDSGNYYEPGSGEVVGRWNPIPIGAYADIIIRRMGATTKDIEAHIRSIVNREVAKDQPFIFIPNENAPGQSGGYFYDKQTGQLHTEEQMGQKSPIYVQLAKGEITEDEAKEKISGVTDLDGNVWSPTGDNTVLTKSAGSDQDGDNDQKDDDEDGTTTTPTPSGTTNKFPNVSSNTAVRSGGKIWVQRPDTKVWEIWVDPTLPEWIKKAIDEDSNVDETIDILSSSTEDLDGDGIPDFLDSVDDTVSDVDNDDNDDADSTTDPSEPITNVWRDSLEQARKEAREKAKEQERIEQEKLAERRREKGYDDLSNTGKSIFDKMVEMGLDPNVISIQHNYTGYGDYGRPDYRNISRFFSNYNTWRAEKAKEKTARRNSQLADVSTAGDTAVTFEGKTYTYDTDKGYWSVSEGDLLETSILYHINKDTGETDDLRPDTDGDGIRDPDDVAPENPDVQTQEQLDKIEQDRLDEIEQDRLDEWNAGDADNDGVLNKDDNNDFLLSSFVGGDSDADKDSDGDGIPDWADPFPEDARKGLGEAGNFGFEWETKDGRKIIIPIFGGGGNEGLNVKWEDGQTRVTIGIMEEGVLVEHDIGSMEEVADKINNAVNEGKTTIDEIQETTLDVLKNIFGPKEKEEPVVVEPEPVVVEPEPVVVPIDNDGDGVYSDVDYDDNDSDVQDEISYNIKKAKDAVSYETGPGGMDEITQSEIIKKSEAKATTDGVTSKEEVNLDQNNGGEEENDIIGKAGKIQQNDEYEKEEIIETSVSPSLASGGGLFQGTTAEALGRFMPKEIVQPVPFARRAATYKRPRYSLFSEYI